MVAGWVKQCLYKILDSFCLVRWAQVVTTPSNGHTFIFSHQKQGADLLSLVSPLNARVVVDFALNNFFDFSVRQSILFLGN